MSIENLQETLMLFFHNYPALVHKNVALQQYLLPSEGIWKCLISLPEQLDLPNCDCVIKYLPKDVMRSTGDP